MSSEPDVDGARGRRWRKPRRESSGSTGSPVVQASDEEFVRAAALAQLDTLVSTPIASAAVMPPTARVELPAPAAEPVVDDAQEADGVGDAAEGSTAPDVEQVEAVADPSDAAAQAVAEDKQDDVLARVAAYSRITLPEPAEDPVYAAGPVETVEAVDAAAPVDVGAPVDAGEQGESVDSGGADTLAQQREARTAHRAVAAAEARARVADTVAAEQAELARQAAE
ncbi:hypothetical protein, partial [Nocardioides sp.]|uniref:hypothetical protein n=1 Tax=Nocardioides sp. TaxID=35761 RepID=UPI00260581FF